MGGSSSAATCPARSRPRWCCRTRPWTRPSSRGVVGGPPPRSGTAVLTAAAPHVARLARHSHGKIVYFSMATGRDEDGWLRVDSHCGRGGAAMVLQETEEGELVVLRHGARPMPLLHAPLMPAP